MQVAGPAERRHHVIEQQDEPSTVEDHQRGSEQRSSLNDRDVEAEGNDRQRDVLAGQHRRRDCCPEEPSLAVDCRVQSGRDGRHGEDDVVEVENRTGKHAPEEEVRALEGEPCDVAETLCAPEVDRNSGDGQQDALRHQQHSCGVPEEPERPEHHEDRMKMIAQQVGDSQHRVGDDLEPAVAPDCLILDAEVEAVGCEVVVAEKRDGGETVGRGDRHYGSRSLGPGQAPGKCNSS